MKRSLLAGAIAAMSLSAAHAGEAVFYITEDGQAINNISVQVDGHKKLVNSNGFVAFDLQGGTHKVELSQFGEWAGQFEFAASKKQSAEVQVDMLGGEAMPEVRVYNQGQAADAPLGSISGYVESDETGGGVAGARISIQGSQQFTMSDADGHYQLALPRGAYSINIAHPNYGQTEVKNLRVLAEVATRVNSNLSLSGDGIIEEVVALGSYVPATATAQERDASAVLDAIGAEQFARFGDSSAASALKRVAGVSVSGGKYVVSRGLNERHSSIMLNGASLPSPDPSRRVVPLDIFPSAMLDGIDVQKSFTPDSYADSTGAAIRLKTKKFPESFSGKISASLGGVSALTLNERDVQAAESSDVLGVGADGDRAKPSEFSTLDENSSASKTSVARSFSENLGTEKSTVLPNASLEMSMGNTLFDDGRVQVGYTGSFKYTNKWQQEDREQNSYLESGGSLLLDDDYAEKRTVNDINLGGGISVGLVMGEHEFTSNTMLLRQTHSENVMKAGTGGDQDQESIEYNLGWSERQFFFQQFTGEHFFADTLETELNWQFSVSQATLESPDERSYSFERDPEDAAEDYTLVWSSVQRDYYELTDENTDISLDLASTIFVNDHMQVGLKYGASMFNRERDADSANVKYKGSTPKANDYQGNLDIDSVVAASIASGDAGVEDASSPAGNYDVSWDLTSYYLMTEFEMFEQFKVLVGARAEDSKMKLNTFTIASTIDNPVAENADVADDKVFTSLSLLYHINENVQARASVYDTINRPDFREISNAFYIDPETNDTFVGNSKLQSSEVSNIDVRLEYYLTDSDSVSVAYFTKDFQRPIEKTLKTGGDVRTFANAEEGELSGFEIDFRRELEFARYSSFIAGNYAQIDSEVVLQVASELRTQAMQGQPDNLANLQFGLDDMEMGSEFTLLVNYQGESLDAIVIGNEPNIFKEARTQLDFNYSQELSDDLTLKVKLKNITDEAYELTQGGLVYRKYKKGSEINLGISMPL